MTNEMIETEQCVVCGRDLARDGRTGCTELCCSQDLPAPEPLFEIQNAKMSKDGAFSATIQISGEMARIYLANLRREHVSMSDTAWSYALEAARGDDRVLRALLHMYDYGWNHGFQGRLGND